MEEIRDWYIANTGYVLQLARPYYEEMTVRDNLTLAAQIKLPESNTLTFQDKLKRVEQVMSVVSA
jgi:ABC-type multidrug transport system ATPase subunit